MATTRESGLIKGLGLVDSTTLVMGSMIGSGVFIVAADISRQVHSPGLMMMTWVVTALLTLIAALSYGELAAAMPHAGGQYVYLREAFGPLAGFLFGWTMFAVIQTGTIAAVAVAFAKYTGIFFPGDQRPELPGGQRRNRSQYATAARHRRHRLPHLEQHQGHTHRRHGAERVHVRQDLRAAGAGGRGLPGGPQSRGGGQPTSPISGATPAGISIPCAWWASPWSGSLFSSDAWNNVTFTAGEVRNPRRNLPLSLALGVAIVSALYIACNLVYLNVLPFDAIQHAAQRSRGRRRSAEHVRARWR